MKRNILIVIVVIVVIVVGLAGVKALQIKAMIAAGASFTVPAETVSGTEVKRETWELTIPAVGSVDAVQGVELKAELAGTVRQIAFESGAIVQKGQLLVQLDTSSEEAQLSAAQAQADLARMNLDRARDLSRQGVISKADLDTNEAAFRQTTGGVDIVKATIGKKTIRAPFTGRAGIRSVNVGQYVDVAAPIVSLHSLDPVYVNFNVPQQRLSELKRGSTVRVTTDAAGEKAFTGKITAWNPEIDPATRNVKVQATVSNPTDELHPGMYARVQVILPETIDVLIVPASAVLHAPYGDSVFVISDVKDDKSGQTVKQVQMTTVRLGDSRGDFVAITSGLTAGQQVVTAGVQKLRNGTPVKIDNSLAPTPQLAPHPAES